MKGSNYVGRLGGAINYFIWELINYVAWLRSVWHLKD